MYEKQAVKGRLPNGDLVELYPISTLAFAVGRDSQTIRKWEVAGHIPPTKYKNKLGHRLYTKEQIDIIVKAAEQCKLSAGREIRKTSFKKKVNAGFELLDKKYKGE